MILVDTGPLVAIADADDRDHERCLTALKRAPGPLLVPATVVVEVGYLLERELGSHAEAAFLRSFREGTFTLVHVEAADLDRMADLIERYHDLPLGSVDASVIAVAERLGIRAIATLDRRHFMVVKPRHVSAFALVPE
jgi:uncharacterized protein